jgi:mannose-6-phosphate isomerase-like protein (cupin superfamily)
MEDRRNILRWIAMAASASTPLLAEDGQHLRDEVEIMIVTSGNGEILVGGKKVNVSPGSMMYCESNQLHGVKNSGSEPLLFYYCKWMA